MIGYRMFNPLDVKKFVAFKGVYDVVSTFDTETSTAPDRSFAWLMLWQFCIDGVVYHGRTIGQLQEFIETLNGCLKDTLYIYVHNLSYEWQFLRKYFEWDKVFAGSQREIYYAETGQLRFIDSLKLSAMSLEKTCKGQAIEKAVGDWDYNQVRTHLTWLTEKEKYYAENDCLCLAEYIENMRRTYGHIKQIPLTKTGITRKNYRDYIKQELKNRDRGGSGKRKDGYNFYYRYYLRGSVPDLATFYTLRRAYWGGFTHASLLNVGKTLKNVTSYDITSSYPTVMIADKFPYKFYTANADRLNYYIKSGYAVLMTVRLYGLKSVRGFGYIPTYKIEECGSALWGESDKKNYVADNGKVLRTFLDDDYIQITITEVDFRLIKEIYTVEKCQTVGNIRVSKKHYLPQVFRDFIAMQYAKKTELKDVAGREEEYQAAKGDINSLYGMTVTDPIREQYAENCGNINLIEPNPDDFETPEEYQQELERIDSEQLQQAYRQGAHPIGLYQWGVYVAAYARRNLLDMILKIAPEDFIYSDTDSIKILHGDKYADIFNAYNTAIQVILNQNPTKYSLQPETIKGVKKPLGVYDLEWTAEKFKCLRAKTYIYQVDGELHCTVAGVPKKRIKKYLESLEVSPF